MVSAARRASSVAELPRLSASALCAFTATASSRLCRSARHSYLSTSRNVPEPGCTSSGTDGTAHSDMLLSNASKLPIGSVAGRVTPAMTVSPACAAARFACAV